jgi:long-chain acyl-CoA synthetase
VLCWVSPVTVGHAADVKNLTGDLATFRPTFILAVPRVFEKVYNAAEQKAAAAGRGKVFGAAAATATAWSRAQDAGGPGLALRARHALFDRLVYAKLRAALGGRTRYAVSGGGPLGERLGHFFRGAGITVLQGYGLTETTAPSTVTTPRDVRMGSVGAPLPGVSVRIEADGEVLVKGPHVFSGYWRDPAADAEAFADGWFRTGDLGSLDADGILRITGRKKEILVTAAGKNVAPAVLEDQLRAHALISQAVVVGDGKPFIAALLTLDADMLPTWLAARGRAVVPVGQAAKDPEVLAELQGAVDAANATVSRAESIRKFVVLDVDFTEEGGHLTPSMKLKRAKVMGDHAADVESLYAG